MSEKRALGSSPSTTPSQNTSSADASAEATGEQPEERRMPLCSGLSALIQAATSQLGHLVDNESSDVSEFSHPSPRHGDGYASSLDGDLRASTSIRSPSIGPEDGMKLSFPEILMTLLLDPDNNDTITFLPDGTFFAIRTKEFSEDLLRLQFHLSLFEEFLEQIQGWGFTRISGDETPSEKIQVFRHPHFKRGVSPDMKHIKFGHNPTDSRMSAVPEGSRIEYSFSDDSTASAAKRRLSPSHLERDSEDTSQKQRAIEETTSTSQDHTTSSAASVGNDSSSEPSQARRRSSTEMRSYALAVTTAQLNLHASSEDDDANETNISGMMKPSIPLVDGAVERATHTIVTDAIETLLFDERHTRETYLKHEKELSKSSLPGVVSISKQLFSPFEDQNAAQQEQSEEGTATVPKGESSKENTLVTATPSQLEAAVALIKQAGSGYAMSLEQAVTVTSTEPMLTEQNASS
jgi:hypothetical protein